MNKVKCLIPRLLLLTTLMLETSRGQLVHSFCSTSQTETVPGLCRPVVKCISFFQNIRRLETRYLLILYIDHEFESRIVRDQGPHF
jgi:hypothetical protein